MKSAIKSAVILLLILFALFACQSKSDYPEPTKEFYVNDFADKLLPAVESTIVREGERLFEEESEDGNISGVQIVFATFAVENETDIAKYNLSDLYNQWGIGKDDMGVLIVYFYVGDTEDPSSLDLKEIKIEIGYAMEVYLSPIEAGNILDTTIMIDEDESIGTAHLLYELLSVVYVDVFGYNSFNYDLDEYQNYLDTYLPYSDYDSLWGWILYVILTPYASWWEKGILVLIGLAILGLGGGVVKNIGGGGRSGGMGIRRRR